MSEVINLMKAHRSIRAYQDRSISVEMLASIIDAARSAASSSFLQCVSVIHVTDKEKRCELVKLAHNQSYVATASDFLYFAWTIIVISRLYQMVILAILSN